MTPGHQRSVFIGFGLLITGVVGNVVLLQPLPSSQRANAEQGQSKLDQDRRQRLALDRASATTAPGAAPAPVAAKMATAQDADEPSRQNMGVLAGASPPLRVRGCAP